MAITNAQILRWFKKGWRISEIAAHLGKGIHGEKWITLKKNVEQVIREALK